MESKLFVILSEVASDELAKIYLTNIYCCLNNVHDKSNSAGQKLMDVLTTLNYQKRI